jgi:hypothetical protein
MNKLTGISGRVHDSFSTKVGIRKGWYNMFCYSLGVIGGIVMRDELYYPNLQKTDDVISHWQKCEELIKSDIERVDSQLELLKSNRGKKGNKLKE